MWPTRALATGIGAVSESESELQAESSGIWAASTGEIDEPDPGEERGDQPSPFGTYTSTSESESELLSTSWPNCL